MLPLLFAAAATVSLQTPLPPAKSPFVYPPQAVKLGQEGAVIYTVFVDPAGKPERCDVEKTIGTDFGKLVCDGIMHATFTHAVDAMGVPSFGVFRTVSNFFIPAKPKVEGAPPSAYPMVLAPEMTLEVKPIAGLIEQTVNVRLALLVDGQGAVVDCGPADQGIDARLVKAACGAARGVGPDKIRTDDKGKPVAFVRPITVSFVPKG
jgi:hypothetical protein